MARTIPSGANSAKNAQFGSEPICVLGVNWGGGVEIKYAERTTPFAQGNIASLGSLSEVIQVDASGSSTSVDVRLLDTDGQLKAILDSRDIHKNRATLYQWFDGLAESECITLFTGEINSPIIWDETTRTLSFTLISKIESLEVGFSPEEGQFADVSPSLIGKTWPLGFGEVINVPAAKSVEKLTGSTQTLIGIPDYTLPYKYWHLKERIQILRQGFQYYKEAIYFLLQTLPVLNADQTAYAGILSNPNVADEVAINAFFGYISATAQGLEDAYLTAVLAEDVQKQAFENLGLFITSQGKKGDDIEAFNNESSEETLDAEKIEGLRAQIDPAFELFVEMVNTNPVMTLDQKSGVISIITKALNDADKKIEQALKQEEFKDAIDAISSVYTALVDSAKACSEATDESLSYIAGVKDLINVDIENAEYAFQNIKSILHKINKLYINEYKTRREIFKVQAVINQHNLIPKSQVVVTGGERFPQNTPIAIAINEMTYFGTFSGKTFTATSIQPRYSGIAVVGSSRVIDSFEVVDPTIDLRGHYCLVMVPTSPGAADYDANNPYGYRIFQVTNQVGSRCTIQLVELTPTADKRNRRKLPLIEQLPDYLLYALENATEHTAEEKKRILENAIPKYDQRDLDRIKSNIDKLKTIAEGSQDSDQISSINDTIYKNIREYNHRVVNARYKVEEIEKANQKISSEEFKNFLRLQNLKYRLADQDDEDYELINPGRYYYVTGYDINYIIASSPVMLPAWFQFAAQGQELEQNNTVVSLPNGSRIRANLLPDSGLWYADVGSSVELINGASEKFIVNTLPSTIVAVNAYRSLNGIRQLVPVPSRYYEKNEADNYGGLTCTSITLKKRLPDYPGEGWEDGLYVSYSSSVGPNTADIIEWLATHYTDLEIDSASFTSVKAALTNYPSSFALLEKRDALELIRDIAWQARCSVWVLDGKLYIRYLSVNPSSTATITESHVLPDSLQLQHTATEDLVTKFVSTWKPHYAVEQPNQVILRHNVNKYGTKEFTYDFFIYNIEDLVLKSATFWMIRKANTWKMASFKTPLLNLQVQSLDGVTLDITPNHFGSEPILGLVQNATYSITDNTIDFLVWLPVRAGEMVPYDFAFPSSIDVNTVYPTVSEIAAGNAGSPGSNVPTNVAFRIDPNINLIDQLDLRPKDYGKAFMSDAYDSYPTSVIASLSESDYITVVPEGYSMPAEALASEQNTKPEYLTPEAQLVKDGGPPSVFVGRVSSVVDEDAGVYKVKASNNREYEVRQFAGGGATLVKYTPVTVFRDGPQLLMNERPQPPASVISHFKVVSERDDYILAKKYDVEGDTTEDEEIAIAKPYLLRRKPFDSKSVTYSDKVIAYTYFPERDGETEEAANDDRYRHASTTVSVSNVGGDAYTTDVTQAQKIVPAYYAGDIISAVKTATGLTADETPVQWTDLNSGGRAWAHSPVNDPDDSDGA